MCFLNRNPIKTRSSKQPGRVLTQFCTSQQVSLSPVRQTEGMCSEPSADRDRQALPLLQASSLLFLWCSRMQCQWPHPALQQLSCLSGSSVTAVAAQFLLQGLCTHGWALSEPVYTSPPALPWPCSANALFAEPALPQPALSQGQLSASPARTLPHSHSLLPGRAAGIPHRISGTRLSFQCWEPASRLLLFHCPSLSSTHCKHE